jgi:hypothetical protein
MPIESAPHVSVAGSKAPPDSPPDRRRVARSPQRSRITNGTAFLPSGTDNRSAWVRRCKDVIAAHLSDLGGENNASAAERSLVRRAAVMTTELERLEARFASAGEASERELDLYIRAAGNLRRLLEAIGLQRRAKDIGPSLVDLIREDLEEQTARERAARQEEQP